MGKISGNVLIIKEINLNIVRKALKNLKSATKSQISKTTGLSSVTVGTILQMLLENNEIEEIKKVQSNGGRPAQEFSYNFNHMNMLIIFPVEKDDKTNLNIDIVNLDGKSIEHNIVEIEEVNLDILKSIVEKKIEEFPKIKIFGFGNPGVNLDGEIIQSDYEKLVGCNLVEEFSKLYNIETIVENDVNAAVVGFHKRRKGDELVYFFFPDKFPPGAGVLIGGKIYKGSRNYAGGIAYLKEFIWNEDLYNNFEQFCVNVSEVINMTSCLLNPSTIILAGNFIEDRHINYIKEYCKNSFIEDMIPRIYLSKNFLLDYKEGLIIRTLETLDSGVSITRN